MKTFAKVKIFIYKRQIIRNMIKKLKQIFKRGKAVNTARAQQSNVNNDTEKNKRITQMLEEYCRTHPQI